MKRFFFRASSAFGLAFLLANVASAQIGMQQFGSTSVGGGGTSNGLFGQRTTGGVGGVSSTNGASLFGTSGSANALGTTSSTLQQGGGTITGQERFLNQNRSAQNFVGVDTNEIQNVGGINTQTQIGRNLQGALNNVQQIQAFRQQLDRLRNGQNFGQNQQTQIRVGLSLGFTAPPATAAPMVAAATQRLTRLPGVSLVGSPEIALEGRTAVVRGIAASEQDRERVSRLLLLEPGISSVRNEMTVAPGTAGPGSLPGSPPAAGSLEPPPAPPQF